MININVNIVTKYTTKFIAKMGKSIMGWFKRRKQQKHRKKIMEMGHVVLIRGVFFEPESQAPFCYECFHPYIVQVSGKHPDQQVSLDCIWCKRKLNFHQSEYIQIQSNIPKPHPIPAD